MPSLKVPKLRFTNNIARVCYFFILLLSYVNWVAANAFCAPGFYGPIGEDVCYPAPVGYYVAEAGAIAPTPAPLGSFVASEGQTFATLASPGFYVPTIAASAPTIAPAGSYVANAGASSATLAAPGTFVSEAGQTHATLASAGYFVPVSGAVEQTIAPAGSFVPNVGASSATPAPKGYFVSAEGQLFATAAAPGYYVSEIGATAATPAPKGYYTANAASISPIATPPGTYVPEEASTFGLICPQDSTSFGAAPACRSGIISMMNPSTVSPSFDSSYGLEETINLGAIDINMTETIDFSIFNSSSDLGYADMLTDLSILSAELSGVNADMFSLNGFMNGTILSELESSSFAINILSMIETSFDVDLTFTTDQFATFGALGQSFTFNFVGRFVDIPNKVHTPSLVGLVVFGFIMLFFRKRYL